MLSSLFFFHYQQLAGDDPMFDDAWHDDDGDTDMLGFFCERYKKTVHNIVKKMTTKNPGKHFFAPAS